MLKQLFRFNKNKNKYHHQAKAIYDQILNRISQDELYDKFKLERSLEAGMQQVFLHLSLIMILLKHDEQDPELSQAIFDYCFKGIEGSYLENGASDYSVGHKMKKALKFFYGGLSCYEQAIVKGDITALKGALRKNIYVKQHVDEKTLSYLALEVDHMISQLKKVDWSKQEQSYFGKTF